jgi:accessory colonization factor AcfC
MLGGRSTNFIIALQNRLSYASPRRIKALLLRQTGIRAKRNTPKKAHKFKHIEPPSGKAKKAQGEALSYRRLHLPART